MSGETNLSKLLQSMQSILRLEEYIFCSVSDRDNSYSHLDS